MADSEGIKISSLPSAGTLNGTETLFIERAGVPLKTTPMDVMATSNVVIEGAIEATNSANEAVIEANTARDAANAAANAGGSPKDSYPTLAALQAAFPTGTTGLYVVVEDGYWYSWKGGAWTRGLIYQNTVGIVSTLPQTLTPTQQLQVLGNIQAASKSVETVTNKDNSIIPFSVIGFGINKLGQFVTNASSKSTEIRTISDERIIECTGIYTYATAGFWGIIFIKIDGTIVIPTSSYSSVNGIYTFDSSSIPANALYYRLSGLTTSNPSVIGYFSRKITTSSWFDSIRLWKDDIFKKLINSGTLIISQTKQYPLSSVLAATGVISSTGIANVYIAPCYQADTITFKNFKSSTGGIVFLDADWKYVNGNFSSIINDGVYRTSSVPVGSYYALIPLRIEYIFDYTLNKNTFLVNPNTITANTIAINANASAILLKQNTITPNATLINFAPYLVNGAINNDNTLNANANYRSILNLPVTLGINVIVLNPVDLLSHMICVYTKADNTVSRYFVVIDMTKYIFTPLAGEAFLSFSLISGAAPVGSASRVNEINLYNSTGVDLLIETINGFKIKPDSTVDLSAHLAAINPHNITPALIGAIDNITLGGQSLPKDSSTVILAQATPVTNGFMSASDKAKLDNLLPAPITISGSGITKNASAFGFLPTKTGDENSIALQNALNGGGTILVDYPGTYNLSSTIYLDSNTTLIFGANVFISRVLRNDGKKACYTFVNRGAFTRTYNENIKILGLHLITNGLARGNDVPYIVGLLGQLSFFYIKNLIIDDFFVNDNPASPFCIHVCTFENIQVTNSYIEGYKDAIHLGRGSKFVIRHCIFKTYDDPIALNAHDYATSNPEMGWIENGIIEDCYDLEDAVRGTTGYFCRILAGAWLNWVTGMAIQNFDTIIASNGKMYRCINSQTDGVIYTSLTEPSHTTGTVTIDGINWVMYQESGVGNNCGVRNVHFKNIYLQKPRGVAFSIHFDKGTYSRSYYPNAVSPVQEDLIFENIFILSTIPTLIACLTPLNSMKLINSILKNSSISLSNVNTTGIVYNTTHVVLMGTTFKGGGTQNICVSTTRPADIKTIGSIVEDATFIPKAYGTTILTNDINLT